MGRKAATVVSAVLVAVAGMAVAETGPVAVRTPVSERAVAHADIIDDAGPMSGFMNTVVEAAVEDTVWAATDWALSAIGITNDSGGSFSEIESELSDIAQDLEDIEGTLTDLDEAIEQETCDLSGDTTLTARSNIDTYIDTYSSYTEDGATTEQILTLVDAILATDGVLSDLDTIHDALLSAGNAEGIIASCLGAVEGPTAGTLGDEDYYEKVANLTLFFYGYQLKGLALLNEAYHYNATQEWAESNDITAVDPTTDTTFCADAQSTDSWYSWCQYAVTETKEIWDHLEDQFALAGLPYSTDEYMIDNGSPYLWVLSLEDFTAAGGDTCTSPLTYDNRCGLTVSSFETTSLTVDYGSYSTWAVAPETAWRDLLSAWRSASSGTPAATMSTLGFSDPSSKIVLTPSWSSTTYGDTVCFVDTSIDRSHSTQPFCDSVSGDGKTTSLLKTSTFADEGECEGYAEQSWVPSTSNDWYDAFWSLGSLGTGCNFVDEFITHPGWTVTSQLDESDYHEFHWPVLDVSAVTCNDNKDGSSRSKTNSAGVYTTCGDDFDSTFVEIVPSPYASGVDAIAPTANSRLAALTDTVEGLPIRDGIESKLLRKLRNAIVALSFGFTDGACSQMDGFVRKVEAKTGTRLTEDEADVLLAGIARVQTIC